MKNTSPKFPSFAAKSTSAYTFGGLPHTWPSKISLFCKEAWKQVLQEGRRFPALGKAVRSCAAVTDPVAVVWSSTARAVGSEGAGAGVPAHKASPPEFTGFVSGNWLCWQRA